MAPLPISHPALVAAVCEAGALGSLAAAGLSPEETREAVRDIRKRTKRPFAVNLLIPDPLPPPKEAEVFELQARLNPYRKALGLPEQKGLPSSPLQDWRRQVEVLLEEGVPILSFALGNPKEVIPEAKRLRIPTLATAATVDEALEVEADGVDAVVAQGAEAGGHRSTFRFDERVQGGLVGTFPLVRTMAKAVRVPIIAAGGIADGRGLAAALALGASGVQLGTRFIATFESHAPEAHKQRILEGRSEEAVVTKSISGRWARGFPNRFSEDFDRSGAPTLPYPYQQLATHDLRLEASRQGRPEFLTLWAGQTVGLIRELKGAAEVVREIVEEARQWLAGGLSASVRLS
jgi:nitronate monooxygenase